MREKQSAAFCADEDGPLAALLGLLASASALVPGQARGAGPQGTPSDDGPHEQPLGDLFSRSLLPKSRHLMQPAARHEAQANALFSHASIMEPNYCSIWLL